MPDEAKTPVLTEDEQEVLRAVGDILIAGNNASLESVTNRVYGPEVVASSDAMMFGGGPPRDRAAERRSCRTVLISLHAKVLIEATNGTVPTFRGDAPLTLTPSGWEWFNANAG